MRVALCALGLIQGRGARVIAPQMINLGPAESDYFSRHVSQVRSFNDATSRATFAAASGTPAQLLILRTTLQNSEYLVAAAALQDLLAQAMRSATNAKDCVFAALRTEDAGQESPYVTLLKLDAVIEAARLSMLESGGMSFEVLQDLLPEPGDLQKGISWPDPRATSDVMTVDRNRSPAAYFETAYQVLVGPRAPDAEYSLVQTLADQLPPGEVAGALRQAQSGGAIDDVLDSLKEAYPQLQDAARDQRDSPRPPGQIRPNKLVGRPMLYEADGIQVIVPSHLLDRVTLEETPDGWLTIVRTATRPQFGPR